VWRIGANNIRLFQQFDTFGRAEIPIPFKNSLFILPDKRVIVRDYIIGVVFAVVNAIDGLFVKIPAEQIGVQVFVAGGNKPLQAEGMKF
jgi:hypothetical protein